MKISSHANTILSMLNVKYGTEPDGIVTEESLEADLNDIIKLLKFTDITNDELVYIKRKLKANHGITKEPDECLANIDEYGSHSPTWFTDIQHDHNEWYLAYEARLYTKKWSGNVITKLGESTDKIMNYLGNPSENSFNVRGLIMGDIQSGKTANFIALCNKAADAGYRVIIVTAGIIEKLRQQTQFRLENEFVNLLSNKTIPTLTGTKFDFKKEQGKNPFSVFRNDVPVLCVIKKNVSVLQHLYEWLQKGIKKSKSENKIVLPWPLLFIDDEADNASINTKKLTEEANPTKTNEYIRKILNLFQKSSYIGVTATPFANVFIDPQTDDDAIKGDLFPKSFVYRLTTPSNYFGSSTLFEDGSPYLKILDDIDFWLPARHKRDEYPSEELPCSLKYAIGYYLLINGVMDYIDENNDAIKHRTMMIHVSRFISIQNRITQYVESYVRKIKARVANYCADANKAENVEEIKSLHNIWDKENLSLRCDKMTWPNFLEKYLYEAIKTIEVISVNSGSSKALDYTEDGKRFIVIGGNALSRGLTLEGLAVSYFRRETMLSDTLLQMGRWCGYRDDYKELIRVWMPEALIDNFGYASQISEDLSQMFHQMVEEECSPADFAIKIRKDPGAMLPTARNKMRTASVANIPIILAGHAIETPRMINDKKQIQINNQCVVEFLLKNKNYIGSNNGWNDMCFYRHVPIENIKDLLTQFKTGVMSYGFLMPDIISYLVNHYHLVDVVIQIPSKNEPSIKDFGTKEQPLKIRILKRQLSLNSDKHIIQINGTKLKVTSGGVMKYILTEHEAKQYSDMYTKQYGKTAPDSYYLKCAEDTHPYPLIVLQYVSLSDKTKSSDLVADEFFAMSIGFPGKKDDELESVETFYLTKTAYSEYINAEQEE